MKLLTLTLRRPSGTTHVVSEKLSEAHAHDANYVERQRARIAGRHSDDVLESWAVVDSTAVRVTSPRNTKVSEQHDLTDTDDGPEMKAGIQHPDAVGGGAIVGDGTGSPLPEIDASAPEGTGEADPFAGLDDTSTADAGDSPPDSPDEAEQPSSPSKKSKK